LGLNEPRVWEVQWHPAGGGRPRRVTLTKVGIRRLALLIALALVLLVASLGVVPLGMRGVLEKFTVDAARRENVNLHNAGEEFHERAYLLAVRLHASLQLGRRLAWALDAPSEVWNVKVGSLPARQEADARLVEWLNGAAPLLTELGERIAKLGGGHPCPLGSLPTAAPVNMRRAVPVALFGWRVSPFTGKREPHQGVRLAAPAGEPVIAPGAGKVLWAGPVRERRANEWSRFGNLVVIDHGGGVFSVLGQLRDVGVSRGQRVARGARVGSVGQTGWTRVPALYFEVRWPLAEGSVPIDPALVCLALPLEDVDAALADPRNGLPKDFASLDHLRRYR
jgi:murein DD-endopeptidase MepM/ murein hydrolase activator NlpD